MTAKLPVTYIPGIIPENQQGVFDDLLKDLAWEQRPDAPRMEYWTNSFGRSYTYGRGKGIRTYESQPSHVLIDVINATVTRAVHRVLGEQFPNLATMEPFEGCFLNCYKGERDHLGWHADDDPGINHDHPIAVVTVGAGRMLQIKRQNGLTGPDDGTDPAQVHDFFLEPGSLLLMHPGMQSFWYHRIPKVGHKVEPRISLTYRALLPIVAIPEEA